MDKDKFNRAMELNNKIEEYKSHKTAFESSNIKYGGKLIFTYNSIKEETKQTVEEAARENILFNHRTVDSFNPHTHEGCDYLSHFSY